MRRDVYYVKIFSLGVMCIMTKYLGVMYIMKKYIIDALCILLRNIKNVRNVLGFKFNRNGVMKNGEMLYHEKFF